MVVASTTAAVGATPTPRRSAMATMRWISPSSTIAIPSATALADGKISPEDLGLFTVTDDVDEAVEVILAHHQMHQAAQIAAQG